MNANPPGESSLSNGLSSLMAAAGHFYWTPSGFPEKWPEIWPSHSIALVFAHFALPRKHQSEQPGRKQKSGRVPEAASACQALYVFLVESQPIGCRGISACTMGGFDITQQQRNQRLFCRESHRCFKQKGSHAKVRHNLAGRKCIELLNEPYLAKKSPNSNLKPEVRVNKRATKPRSEALNRGLTFET